MKFINETDRYVLIFCPHGKEGAADFPKAMEKMMAFMERLRDEGFRPLHYVPRMQAWMCEKEARFFKDEKKVA